MIATLPPPATPPSPVGPPAAVSPNPTAPGQTGEQAPGGFARLLDQAREEPAPATTGPDSPAETDKATRARTTRSGAARATATTTAKAGAATPKAAQAGAGLSSADAIDSEETPTASDAAPAPPAATDTAALLAALASFARPQPAREPSDGPAARSRGDADDANLDARGNPALPRAAKTAPAAAQPEDLAASPAGGKQAAAARAAGAAAEIPASAEAAAGTGSRSFAAELQALLPTAAMAGQPASVANADTTPAAAPPALQGHLAASPGSPAFAPELGATLATFVREGVQHARLELHPAEMGPLTVQIQLDGQAAQVHLSAHNADTRQALEQAMPQLAGSLREAGLTLSGGGVFEQPRQPQSQEPSDSGGRRGAGEPDREKGGAHAEPAARLPVRRRGVVDLVA